MALSSWGDPPYLFYSWGIPAGIPAKLGNGGCLPSFLDGRMMYIQFLRSLSCTPSATSTLWSTIFSVAVRDSWTKNGSLSGSRYAQLAGWPRRGLHCRQVGFMHSKLETALSLPEACPTIVCGTHRASHVRYLDSTCSRMTWLTSCGGIVEIMAILQQFCTRVV